MYQTEGSFRHDGLKNCRKTLNTKLLLPDTMMIRRSCTWKNDKKKHRERHIHRAKEKEIKRGKNPPAYYGF